MSALILLLHSFFFFQYVPSHGVANSRVTSTPWVTSQTIGTLRSDFTGCVGMSLTVGASNITVTDLGRWVVSGNSLAHTVVISNNAGNADIASASVITLGATSNAFTYTAITPVVLTAGTIYNLFSNETSSGDQWGDDNGSVTTSAVATIGVSAVSSTPTTCFGQSGHISGKAYVPPNFKYHL